MTTARERGQTLFAGAQCTGCHTPVMRTAWHEIDALANRDAVIYSISCSTTWATRSPTTVPTEAPTAASGAPRPLGHAYRARVSRRTLLLMHDGRARSVDEAIRLHGGEATAARDAYLALPAADKTALIDFVESR